MDVNTTLKDFYNSPRVIPTVISVFVLTHSITMRQGRMTIYSLILKYLQTAE